MTYANRITTREQFKDYIFRRLGAPVIQINVDDEQVDDRVDDALQYYFDYHFDGSQLVYYRHQLTPEDITNKYILLSENFNGVVEIFDIGDAGSGGSSSALFNVNYQIYINELYNYSSVNASNYYLTKQHIALLEEVFVGKQPIRYNRHINRLYIDMDWNKVNAGDFIIVKGYQIVDPNDFPDVWNDRWLKRYATALVKKQWGDHMSKFGGIQLPGGITLDGPRVIQEAQEEINQLEQDMMESFSLPVYDMTG